MTAIEGATRPTETEKMGRVVSAFESVDAYSETLRKAGLPEDEIRIKANAYSVTHPIVGEQIATPSVRMGRKVSAAVQAAKDAGVPQEEIDVLVQNAIGAAIADHRKKVGLFGQSGSFVRELRITARITRANKGFQGTAIVNRPRF